jgi:hypothetical protein
LPIAGVDRGIVTALRVAHAPDVVDTHPLRPEVDFITREKDGTLRAPEAVVAEVAAGLREAGLEVKENATYSLIPSTQTWRFSTRYPGQVLCLEVRRDLLVERYTPFEEMTARPEAVERVAAPLARGIASWLATRRS